MAVGTAVPTVEGAVKAAVAFVRLVVAFAHVGSGASGFVVDASDTFVPDISVPNKVGAARPLPGDCGESGDCEEGEPWVGTGLTDVQPPRDVAALEAPELRSDFDEAASPVRVGLLEVANASADAS